MLEADMSCQLSIHWSIVCASNAALNPRCPLNARQQPLLSQCCLMDLKACTHGCSACRSHLLPGS